MTQVGGRCDCVGVGLCTVCLYMQSGGQPNRLPSCCGLQLWFLLPILHVPPSPFDPLTHTAPAASRRKGRRRRRRAA